MLILLFFYSMTMLLKISQSAVVNYELNESTGYCIPYRWYSLGPCQHCYCAKPSLFTCNSHDVSQTTNILLGSDKLIRCKDDLKTVTDLILQGVAVNKKPIMRGGPLSSDEDLYDKPRPPLRYPSVNDRQTYESSEVDRGFESRKNSGDTHYDNNDVFTVKTHIKDNKETKGNLDLQITLSKDMLMDLIKLQTQKSKHTREIQP